MRTLHHRRVRRAGLVASWMSFVSVMSLPTLSTHGAPSPPPADAVQAGAVVGDSLLSDIFGVPVRGASLEGGGDHLSMLDVVAVGGGTVRALFESSYRSPLPVTAHGPDGATVQLHVRAGTIIGPGVYAHVTGVEVAVTGGVGTIPIQFGVVERFDDAVAAQASAWEMALALGLEAAAGLVPPPHLRPSIDPVPYAYQACADAWQECVDTARDRVVRDIHNKLVGAVLVALLLTCSVTCGVVFSGGGVGLCVVGCVAVTGGLAALIIRNAWRNYRTMIEWCNREMRHCWPDWPGPVVVMHCVGCQR